MFGPKLNRYDLSRALWARGSHQYIMLESLADFGSWYDAVSRPHKHRDGIKPLLSGVVPRSACNERLAWRLRVRNARS